MTLMETAQLLGNFGEFFGAIAVVATLGFLVSQIHQNTKQMRRMEMNAGMSQFSAPRMAIVSDQSLAELIVKRHHGGGDLGDADQLRFDSWVGEQMWAFFHSWDRVQADSMESDLWIRPGLGGFLQLEGVWSSWEASRFHFPEPFQAEVERVREDLRRLGEGE